MPAIAVQMYTVRDLTDSFPGVLRRVADEGYDGVEFAYRVRESPPEDVRQALAENDLSAVSAHVPYDELESDFESVVEMYGELGCSTLVIPALDDSHFESAEAVAETATKLSSLGDRLSDRGFDLLYHNHTHEFGDLDGDLAFERLIRETSDSVGFELDVGLATKGGADPVALLRTYADRIPLVHVTDTLVDDPDRDHVELGDGDTDLESAVEVARDLGIEWFVFEHGQSTAQAETLQRGGERLQSLLGVTGD
ncbi:sugar phosphate isomerase/epimerase family protein [Halogeometricum borinquense]|nr:sugar phosphate isomerase/epimerase [Halogeometricum borinquense]